MSVHDVLRWGDFASIPIGVGETAFPPTKQLLQAHWKWPLTWTVMLIAVPQFDPSESHTLTLTWRITVGCGQAMATWPEIFTFTSPYPAVIREQIFIPAQDIQIVAQLSGAPNTSIAETLEVSTFAAPMTEPHAPLHLLERMRGKDPEERGAASWMPSGFHEERLGYR